MSKIMVLGPSGGGKSTSIGKNEKLGIKGLNPSETFVIACAHRVLPFPGWMNLYKRAKVRVQDGTSLIIDISPEGNYQQTSNPASVANLITLIHAKRPDIKNIVIDDMNYLMQDYYMANAMKGGYDVFKKIGAFMNKIFSAIQNTPVDKNTIVLAHYEEFKSRNGDVISYRFKTVGKMVQDYITPEGKFDYIFYAVQDFDDTTKTVTKKFVTNYDGEFPAKSSYGVFTEDEIRIPNDLGYVLEKIDAYNLGQ